MNCGYGELVRALANVTITMLMILATREPSSTPSKVPNLDPDPLDPDP